MCFFLLMIRLPPISSRTVTLFPYPTLFRPLVPSLRGRPGRRARRDDPARVGDIAGLDRADAEPAIKLHRIVELRLIHRDIAAGFVMADQLDALLAPVIGDRLQVEIGRRRFETELVAMPEPLAVSDLFPTLYAHHPAAVPPPTHTQ